MNEDLELEMKIRERLEEIKPVLARDPQTARQARAQFLAMAVSISEEGRHKGWSSIFRKERFAMNIMISILVIAGLLLGGGATVSAAQDDLPNQPLYSMKMWSEDLSLQLRNEPEQKVERLMELAQVRVQEMTRLADAGQAVPDQTRLRLEQHIHEALQLCSNLDDAALDRTLLQIRERLQQQDRDMERLQLHTPQDTELAQTRTLLQQRLQLVEQGLLNHEMFRNAVRDGFRFGHEEKDIPPVQNGNGQQNGQPTSIPMGPNPNPGGPNEDPIGPSTGTGEPNDDPGGPNMDPGGPNSSSTPQPNGDGSGSGGKGPGDGSGGSGSGSGGSGGSGSGPGGDSGGGGGSGGQGSGSGGSGGNKP